MSKEQPEALRLEEKWRAVSAQQAEEISRLHAENEALRAQIGQGEPTDEQIMATVQQKGFGFSQSRPLAQQWDQVCELIRAVVRERNTHPAPQQKPLTDEQIGMAFRKTFPVGSVVFTNGAIEFARAIEAAHNIGEKK